MIKLSVQLKVFNPFQPLNLLFILLIFLSGCAGYRAARKELLPSGQPRTPPAKISRIEYRISPWYHFKQAACSLTFDDGTLDQYMIAYPELERRNIKATFFLITSFREEGYWDDYTVRRRLLSWDQAREIAFSGHEIGSHGKSHVQLLQETDIVEDELRDSRNRIRREIPWQRAIIFAWPYWRSDEESRYLARRYYIGARAGVGIPACYAERHGGIPHSTPANIFHINSLAARNADSNESWQTLCDRVLAEGGWFVPSFHGIDDGAIDREALGWEAITLSRFRLVLDYLQQQNFWLVPFGSVTRYIRERDAAILALKNSNSRSLVLVLDDNLDDSIYDHPLSLRVKLPAGWQRIRLSQGGRLLRYRVDRDGYHIFDAFPDGSDIIIYRIE